MICDTNTLVTSVSLCLVLALHLRPALAQFMREVAAPDLDTGARPTFLPRSSAWSRPGPPYRETNEQYSQGSYHNYFYLD